MPNISSEQDRQRYFLTLSYTGTPYAGWQRQPRAMGVQQVVEEALTRVLRHKVSIMGSGRTDAGVHALGQVAHFDAAAGLVPAAFLHQLNGVLPPEVAACGLHAVPHQAHARYDAIFRRYTYRLHCSKQPLLQPFSHYCPYQLDIVAMNQAAAMCVSHRDFRAFAKSGSTPSRYTCVLRQAHWHQEGQQWVFTITGIRFLRGMVRTMVGTLIEIGRGRLHISDINRILQSRSRTQAGISVPPCGLCLVAVGYPLHLSRLPRLP